MRIYRTSQRSQNTYYSYASRVFTARGSQLVGAIAWCVVVVYGLLASFDVYTSTWCDWTAATSAAVLFAVAGWRWYLRRRVQAQAGFRTSSPE